jgi:hypothetical protein
MIWDCVATGNGMLEVVGVATGDTEADRSQAARRRPATRMTSIMAVNFLFITFSF